ncbi:hypothetical protein ACJW30_11G024200 [Castanea mollissima]
MEWRDGFLLLCLTGMLFQLDIIPCTYDQSIITYALQTGGYFIKQLCSEAWLKGRLSMLLKLLTTASSWS